MLHALNTLDTRNTRWQCSADFNILYKYFQYYVAMPDKFIKLIKKINLMPNEFIKLI
jgi:hypothetical protein